MRHLVVFLLVLAASAVASTSFAHGMRTAYVEIVEVTPGKATVHLRLGTPAPVQIESQAGCTLERAGDATSLYDRAWQLDCADGALAGHTLAMRGLGPVVNDVVVWMSYADGTTASHIVKADEPTFELRNADSGWSVARAYLRLGVVHILTGYDHLLFLALLVLLLRTPRSVLLAESAFTLSHSVSFSATALGWIHVSSVGAEACIALSLVLLAADIQVRGAPASASRGAAMALVFGLVHGLGFAGGLREIGLPEDAIAPALVSFGAGVEVGQVAFLAVVLGALYLLRRVQQLPRIELGAVYAAGAVSAFWLFERVAVCVSSRG